MRKLTIYLTNVKHEKDGRLINTYTFKNVEAKDVNSCVSSLLVRLGLTKKNVNFITYGNQVMNYED